MMRPSSLWTILMAVVARLRLSFGTEAYAAASEGMPVEQIL
jgi:hypothetical protein